MLARAATALCCLLIAAGACAWTAPLTSGSGARPLSVRTSAFRRLPPAAPRLVAMAAEEIAVNKSPSEAEIAKMKGWPTWGCDASKFPWTYEGTETCYILEGCAARPSARREARAVLAAPRSPGRVPRCARPWPAPLSGPRGRRAREVTVTPDDGRQAVTVGAGDMVVFPNGMSCTWDVKKAIRKHYNFS